MTINVDLLRATIAHIEANPAEANPAEWKQSTWRMCLAAHAAILGGGRWVHQDRAGYLTPEPDDPDHHLAKLRGGEQATHAADRAQRILGLTDDQAERLFYTTNDLGRLILIASELCEEAES